MAIPDVVSAEAADRALALRDQALTALAEGDLVLAGTMVDEAVAVLTSGGIGGGLDEAAILIARTEIEVESGSPREARSTIEAAVVILDAAFVETDDDPVDPDTAWLWCQAHEELAALERSAGEFDAALTRLRVVLDRAASVFGEASIQVVSAANALGVASKYAGCFEQAADAYQRALAAHDQLGDADAVTAAALLHNLAGLAHSRGDSASGIPLAERGLAMRIEACSASHPDTARDLNALGALYHLAGRLGDAGAAYVRALTIFESCYGSDHFEVAMTCANLAVLAGDEGRPGEAEALGRRTLRILEAVVGPDDVEVALTLVNLSSAVVQQGRNTEAAALVERAGAILSSQLPPGHPHVVAARRAAEACQLRS